MPSISIVIPTHNRAHLITRALDSCFAQGIPDLEVIVVDDASTDATADVIDDYSDSIRCFCLENNQGAQVARNLGLEKATGDYIPNPDLELKTGVFESNLTARMLKAKHVVLLC